MATKDELLKRSNAKCELCSAENDLEVYQIPPDAKGTVDDSILICSFC
jgi:protein PhnA